MFGAVHDGILSYTLRFLLFVQYSFAQEYYRTIQNSNCLLTGTCTCLYLHIRWIIICTSCTCMFAFYPKYAPQYVSTASHDYCRPINVGLKGDMFVNGLH